MYFQKVYGGHFSKGVSRWLQAKVGFIDNSADNNLFETKFDVIVDGITKAIITSVNKIDQCPTCGQKINA